MQSLVQHFSQYIQLNDQLRAEIFNRVIPQSFRKGEMVHNARNICTQSHFINTGLLRLYFLKDGKEIKCFIQANPQFKTISIYDSELKKIDNKHFRDIKQIDVECEILGESKKKVLGEDKKQQANTKSLAKRRNNRSNKL